jgi:hypothetical protein
MTLLALAATSEEACQCSLDEPMATVPFEDFMAYEAATAEDPTTATPQAITGAIASCA